MIAGGQFGLGFLTEISVEGLPKCFLFQYIIQYNVTEAILANNSVQERFFGFFLFFSFAFGSGCDKNDSAKHNRKL